MVKYKPRPTGQSKDRTDTSTRRLLHSNDACVCSLEDRDEAVEEEKNKKITTTGERHRSRQGNGRSSTETNKRRLTADDHAGSENQKQTIDRRKELRAHARAQTRKWQAVNRHSSERNALGNFNSLITSSFRIDIG